MLHSVKKSESTVLAGGFLFCLEMWYVRLVVRVVLSSVSRLVLELDYGTVGFVYCLFGIVWPCWYCWSLGRLVPLSRGLIMGLWGSGAMGHVGMLVF